MSDTMDVSILICVKNCAELTSACLNSLWPTLSPGRRVEVLIFDDQSSDGTPELLASLGERVRTVRGAEPGYFGRNMNTLAGLANGRWLCLLNNDTLLYPNWLDALLAVGESQPKAAVVGNLHVFPNGGRINHAGMVFDREKIARHLYLGLAGGLAQARTDRRFQSVSGACWLTPRERFRDLGGFDPVYVNGYEDLDFCFRARTKGYEIWYAGQSKIAHYGQSTDGRMRHEDANRKHFVERWANSIVTDLETEVARDGVNWPARSLSYSAARWIWRQSNQWDFLRDWARSPFAMRMRNRLVNLLGR